MRDVLLDEEMVFFLCERVVINVRIRERNMAGPCSSLLFCSVCKKKRRISVWSSD